MSLGYGWEKFHDAIHSLTSAKPIRERLINALVYSLIHIKPDADLPLEIQADFKALLADLSKEPAKGDEGTIAATISKLSEESTRDYVKKIVSMHDAVTRAYATETASKRVAKK